MPIKHMDEYRDPGISRSIVERIRELGRRDVRLMEVCGTHTTSIFRSGIRSLLPATVELISGPGCPVCVTAQGEIDAFIELSKEEDTIITTFGDLMRVPGTSSSLQRERADGGDIRIVYSTMDALELARQNPSKRVVFLGVGFETTAPTIAASVFFAREMGISNFSVFSAHKLVPPALDALMAGGRVNVDGFILPGHVSLVIGLGAYRPFFEKHQIPCVVGGFEPADILQVILTLVEQIEGGTPELVNGYPRAVTEEGNTRAVELMGDVFETVDAAWRGLGVIPDSGLKFKEEFAFFDSEKVFRINVTEVNEPKGCACGEILTGVKKPPECPLYKKTCTPADPIGPCMVSSEGTCAAYYKYHD